MTLLDAINQLYAEFGCYRNALHSFAFEGESGMHTMDAIMKQLRQTPPTAIGGMAVESLVDYNTAGTGLPKANVLEFRLAGGAKLMVRPSGTEPKIKVYLSAVAPTEEAADAINDTLGKAASAVESIIPCKLAASFPPNGRGSFLHPFRKNRLLCSISGIFEVYKMKTIQLTPSCKDYLWGGEKLRTEYGIQSELHPLSEAWMLCPATRTAPATCRTAPPSSSTSTLIPAALAPTAKSSASSPFWQSSLMPKKTCPFRCTLNEYALEHEHQYGKTEMWYVLEAEPGASLYYGFTHEISKEEFERRIPG